MCPCLVACTGAFKVSVSKDVSFCVRAVHLPFNAPLKAAMHAYPIDSPRAAACVLALTLVSDGTISQDELNVVERLKMHEQLNLSRDELFDVFDTLRHDLIDNPQSNWVEPCPVDEREIAAVMARITSPFLRERILRLCIQVAEADGHIAGGEAVVLKAAVEHWGLHRQMLHTVSPSNV